MKDFFCNRRPWFLFKVFNLFISPFFELLSCQRDAKLIQLLLLMKGLICGPTKIPSLILASVVLEDILNNKNSWHMFNCFHKLFRSVGGLWKWKRNSIYVRSTNALCAIFFCTQSKLFYNGHVFLCNITLLQSCAICTYNHSTWYIWAAFPALETLFSDLHWYSSCTWSTGCVSTKGPCFCMFVCSIANWVTRVLPLFKSAHDSYM